MGASDQLLAARWADTLPVSGGPDINNLEAVVKLITGIDYATTISVGLGLNEKCQFASPIRARGSDTAGSNGLRLRDITNGDEWLIQSIDGNIDIYYNTGSEDSPSWTFHGRVPISCICHVTEGDLHSVGSSGYTVQWDTVVREEISTMWDAGNPTRVVAPMAGYYRARAGAYQAGITFTGWLFGGFLLNGGATAMTGSEMTKYVVTTGSTPGPSWEVEWQGDLSASDYLELSLAAQSSITIGEFWMMLERLR